MASTHLYKNSKHSSNVNMDNKLNLIVIASYQTSSDYLERSQLIQHSKYYLLEDVESMDYIYGVSTLS